MARNRKNESSFRLVPILTALAVCGLFATLGLGYVWYKSETNLLGRQIKERETILAQLERNNKNMQEQLAVLCSPVNLDAQVRKMNLGLGPPALAQIVRLVEKPAESQPPAATADLSQPSLVQMARNE